MYVTYCPEFRIINMKIYMEVTLNIMPKAEVDRLLKQDVKLKELPKGRYIVIVTNP